jgi:hypothetical protein
MASLVAEKAREKAGAAYEKLQMILDSEGHDESCVLRCVEDVEHKNWKNGFVHSCEVCKDDE